VVADAPGSYTVTATVTPTQPDPNPANNTATFQLQVVAPTTTPTIAVTKPTTKRSGSIVSATVHVTANGAPALPTGVVCAATLGQKKLRGESRVAKGIAQCRYAIPRTSTGKALHGTVTITAEGITLTRRFTVA
jgi:hypothetical protein